jgi:putative DNA base modification enzyme with NMAD domain
MSVKIAMLRVGIDSGSGGIDSPLFADGSFEYLPIPDSTGVDERTYGNQLAHDGCRPLSDFFPPSRQAAMRGQSMHLDPEFTTFTYGDPTPPKAGLRRLEAGDMLVFYAGLRGHDHAAPPALYLIGYFDVAFAGIGRDLTHEQIQACRENFHVRHESVFQDQRARLVLVKGSPSSRMLSKAVKISVIGQDRSGKPLKILSPEMQEIFGSFNGKLSFQRSPTRWVAKEHVQNAARFVRGLA